MHILRMLLVTLLLAGSAAAQQLVSFPTQDGGMVYADLYGGKSERGVVLAHGGRFTKESWTKQAQVLEKSGFRVLAIDFRGRGQSRGPQSKSDDDGTEYDVLPRCATCTRLARKPCRLSAQVLEAKRPPTPRSTRSQVK
jgi:pimeloyl-ACP methyl ester carboxylesterase